MTALLELKETMREFYCKNEIYILPLLKFVLAVSVFFTISSRMGYMERINSFSMLVVLALACGILPLGALLLVSGGLVLLHCYALSLPVAVTALVLFFIMYLLYFRFSPHAAVYALLTPLMFCMGVPYVVPIINGLLGQPVSVLSTVCGLVVYFFLHGVIVNDASLSGMDEETTILDRFSAVINQFTGNKEMYLVAGVFVLVALLVYLIRRLPLDYSWTIAIAVGVLIEFLLLYVGYMEIGRFDKLISLLIGSGVSVGAAFLIQFFCFNLDYSRTERVQFEDDDYYYYVKAVPKKIVSTGEKTVKKISGDAYEDEAGKDERMEEMDIHVDGEKR